MLDMALQILSVLGIILLAILGILLLAVLLVLFFPIFYRIVCTREGKELEVNAKADWFPGLVRVRFVLREQKRLTVKALWFSIYDSDAPKGQDEKAGSVSGTAEEMPEEGRPEENAKEKTEEKTEKNREENREEKKAGKTEEKTEEIAEENADKKTKENTEENEEARTEESGEAERDEPKKFSKIWYTIRGIYDKIKKIWQNISYYAELLREDETRLLFRHVMVRLGRIWKSIRPGKLKAKVLFGTGSPDTTGYLYGVYGMLLPTLGQDVLVTPDFQEAVLEGNVYAAGHLTVAVLLWHLLRVAMDRKLWRFRDKLFGKSGRSSPDSPKKQKPKKRQYKT